jgi:hypothetical protein
MHQLSCQEAQYEQDPKKQQHGDSPFVEALKVNCPQAAPKPIARTQKDRFVSGPEFIEWLYI